MYLLIENGAIIFARGRNTCMKSTRISSSYDKRVKGFWIWDTVQDVRVKIPEDLNIVENGNFIRVSTEAAVRGCKFTGKYTQRSHIIVKLQDLS